MFGKLPWRRENQKLLFQNPSWVSALAQLHHKTLYILEAGVGLLHGFAKIVNDGSIYEESTTIIACLRGSTR